MKGLGWAPFGLRKNPLSFQINTKLRQVWGSGGHAEAQIGRINLTEIKLKIVSKDGNWSTSEEKYFLPSEESVCTVYIRFNTHEQTCF
jgi:hypothetical protein